MKYILSSITLFLLILFSYSLVSAQNQANLTIENKSKRTMTVKVMQGVKGYGSLYANENISSYSSGKIYFSKTGNYYTKTKAELAGSETIYRLGDSFHVTNDESGYSVLTLTFTIKESAIPQVTGGKQISKVEFDQN